MSHMDLAAPPRREDRLKACIAYGGSICDGYRPGKPCALMADAGRGFTQGSICLLLPALGIMGSLPDTVVLLHGAAGCGSSLQGQNANIRAGHAARRGSPRNAIWLSTSLDEAAVIGGGEERLEAAIREADARYAPQVILVVATCVPSIIGDDIDAAVARAAPTVNAKVVPVHCEGFKTRLMATAYDAVYHGLGRALLPPPANPIEREERTVNLMNVSSMGRVDEIELERLLLELGLSVNVYPVFSRPESLARAARAALSVSVCPTHDDYLLGFLEERYGVPHIIRHMPCGIANTSRWLLDIAEFFGLGDRARRLVEGEEAELRLALRDFLPLFKGKRVFITAGEYRSLATASLLLELGFQIAGIRSFHYDEFADTELEKLENQGTDFSWSVANVQPFEEANLLKKLQPDLFLGHWNGNHTAARSGVPAHVIYNTAYGYFGYRGVYDLARRLYRKLSNTAFTDRLRRHGRLPYRAEWYAEDPFRHIHGGREGDA